MLYRFAFAFFVIFHLFSRAAAIFIIVVQMMPLPLSLMHIARAADTDYARYCHRHVISSYFIDAPYADYYFSRYDSDTLSPVVPVMLRACALRYYALQRYYARLLMSVDADIIIKDTPARRVTPLAIDEF